jgi:hypothetical protein
VIDQQSLDPRGWRTELLAPLTPVEDPSATLNQLDQALVAFRPVLRPLIAEVGMCWREEYGLPSQRLKWPRHHDYAVPGALGRVALRRFYAPEEPVETVAAIDRDLIAGELSVDAPPEPGLTKDWYELRTLAVAVRALEPIEGIHVAGMATAVVQPWEPGWFAGPVGEHYTDAVPPATLVVGNEGRVRVQLAVHWSRWFSVGNPERKLVEDGIAVLLGQGWVVE